MTKSIENFSFGSGEQCPQVKSGKKDDKSLLEFDNLKRFFLENDKKSDLAFKKYKESLEKELNTLGEDLSDLHVDKIVIALVKSLGVVINQRYLEGCRKNPDRWEKFRRKFLVKIPKLDDLFKYAKEFQSNTNKRSSIIDRFCDKASNFSIEERGINYTAHFSSKSGFISVYNEEKEEGKLGYGWKFRISIKNYKDNLKNGWNVVKDILVDYEINSFKLYMDELELSKAQKGKQITIYAFDNPNFNKWEELFTRIEKKLREMRIISDQPVQSDRRVPGSNYISYRNDSNPDEGGGVTAKEAMKKAQKTYPKNAEEWYYNPYNQKDPWIEMKLSVEDNKKEEDHEDCKL